MAEDKSISRREMRPSDRMIADQEDKVKAERLARDRIAMIRHDMHRTFSTASGKRVLKWLQQRCNHNKVKLSVNNTGTIDPMLTTFAAMEENLYLDIKAHLPNQLIAEIEYGDIQPSGTITDDDTGLTIGRTGSKRSTSR